MLRFLRWEVPAGVSLAAILPAAVSRCGIYALEFEDGTEYVGQTTNIVKRFADHRRRQPGVIVALRFAEVAKERLDLAEKDVIARLGELGVRLRNINYVSLPLRPDALDPVVQAALQERWLLSPAGGELVIDERGKMALQRQRTQRKFAALRAREDFSQIVDGVAGYLKRCIPLPHKSEQRFWIVSSLPSTSRSKEWQRLAAVSINWLEVLVIGEVREDGSWEGFMNLDRLTPGLPRRRYHYATHEYGNAGEVLSVYFDSPQCLQRILADEAVMQGAARLAMGLLRKGPTAYSRFHDYNLADAVFCRLEEMLDAAAAGGGR